NDVAGLLSVNNGSGINTVLLGVAAGDASTVGAMKLTGGSSTDAFIAGGDSFTALGAVAISNGGGVNSTQFESTGSVTIGGTLSVTGGSDVDITSFGIGGTTAVNLLDVAINNGSGFSLVSFAGANHTINGNLT